MGLTKAVVGLPAAVFYFWQIRLLFTVTLAAYCDTKATNLSQGELHWLCRVGFTGLGWQCSG